LRIQVGFRDGLMVENRQRADASKYEVLGHFVGESFHGNQEDIGRPDPLFVGSVSHLVATVSGKEGLLFLCLDTPQANLSIIERDLV
jgi:hypothetical protein